MQKKILSHYTEIMIFVLRYFNLNQPVFNHLSCFNEFAGCVV